MIIFTLSYIASCITKHFRDFKVLLLGRLLGGVSTSLLFSVFDSWLIKAHTKAGLEGSYLSKSFAAASYGNYVIAIVAGLIANQISSKSEMIEYSEGKIFFGGYLNPFDLSLIVLIFCASFACLLWEENHGEQSSSSQSASSGSSGSFHALKNATQTFFQNEEVLLCGLISALFEGSMYVFVFMWTPALTNLSTSEDDLPFGLIFATFMVCCMAGSSSFTILLERKETKIEVLAVQVLFGASCALFIACLTKSETISFLAMNVFEITVGLYFPSMGTQKSQIVPEAQRSAIYNIYRVPLNFIVLTSLLTNLSYRQSFFACGSMLFIGALLQMRLAKMKGRNDSEDETEASSITTPLKKDENV